MLKALFAVMAYGLLPVGNFFVSKLFVRRVLHDMAELRARPPQTL